MKIKSDIKIQCDRRALLAALSVVSGAVPSRSPKPVLYNVKLIADEAGAILMGTDLEVGIRYRVSGVKVDEPGQILLPMQKLNSILRTSSDQEVTIKTVEEGVQIRTLRSWFNLPFEDPKKFPDVADFKPSSYHILAASALREIIRRTSFATDPDSTRFALGGVFFEAPSSFRLRAVATDGRRLAIASAPVEAEGTPEIGSPVVPDKGLRLITRCLADDGPPVHLAFDDNRFLVRTEDAVITGQLVQGKFPPYQDAIPATPENPPAIVQAGELRAACEQATIVTNAESRGVDFLFNLDTLRLDAQAPDLGKAEVDLPIRYHGKPINITFDARYIVEALRTLDDAEELAISLTDKKTAIVLRAEDRYVYVVMPLFHD